MAILMWRANEAAGPGKLPCASDRSPPQAPLRFGLKPPTGPPALRTRVIPTGRPDGAGGHLGARGHTRSQAAASLMPVSARVHCGPIGLDSLAWPKPASCPARLNHV